jgi:hypothetical protein
LDVGQCAEPVPVAPKRRIASGARWMVCASQTSSASHPSLSAYEGLGEVGVEPDVLTTGQFGRAGHQPLGDRERRAGAHGDLQVRPGRGVVEAVDRGFRAGQRVLGGLDEVVRRQPAVGLAAVHRPAHDVQPDADPLPGRGQRRDLVAAVAGEDVVVVGDGRAPGQGEPGHPGRGGGVRDLRVEATPDRVERDQPLEERVVGGHPAGRPLVEVVVGVDQAGGDQAAGGVDTLVELARVDAFADFGDPVVLDDHVPAGVLLAADGGDRPAGDERPHATPPFAATRTASRIFS